MHTLQSESRRHVDGINYTIYLGLKYMDITETEFMQLKCSYTENANHRLETLATKALKTGLKESVKH